MPKIATLETLFRAIAAGDQERALAVAAEVAAAEDRKRNRSAAHRLRAALASTNYEPSPTIPRFARSVAVPQSMLIVEPPGPPLSGVCLRAKSRDILEQLILEHLHAEELAVVDLSPRRRVLLTGAPGTGKTLTARALAHELHLPAYSARLSSVIGSYLGETASNLRVLFHFAATTPCVLLLDEFDAIGRQRGRQDDVGEIDRVLVSVLQELDHQEPLGLIVAATNISGSLDPALLRRFDVNVALPIPNLRERAKLAQKLLRERSLTMKGGAAYIARETTSYADVVREVEFALRTKLISKYRSQHDRV